MGNEKSSHLASAAQHHRSAGMLLDRLGQKLTTVRPESRSVESSDLVEIVSCQRLAFIDVGCRWVGAPGVAQHAGQSTVRETHALVHGATSRRGVEH